jgi:hypothetical protein
MGVHKNITFTKFPAQSNDLGRRVRVCYHYEVEKAHEGVIVRDDVEDPGIMLIRLDNGRHVLAAECQYQFV